MNFFQVIRNKKWVLAACLIVGALAGGLAVWGQPYTYQAKVLLELQDLNQNVLNSRDVNPTARTDNYSETYVNTEAQILQSRPVFERVARQLNRESRWTPPIGAEEITKNVRVKTREADRILELLAESRDPQRAAAIANAITTAFVEQDLDSRVQAGRQTSAWLSKQLDDLGEKLRRSEGELQSFTAREHFLLDNADGGGVAASGLRQVQNELARAESERIAKQSALETIKATPQQIESGVGADATLQQYQIQLTTLKKQLAELEATYAPDYYKLPPIRAQIATVQMAYDLQRKAVHDQLESDYLTAQRREGLLQARYDSQFTQTADQTARTIRYNSLKSEVELNRAIYSEILQKVKSYGIASAMQTSNVRVVEPAVVPEVPSRPNKPLISALGGLGFLFAGLVWVLSRAAGDTSIQEPGESQFYTQSPELGVIPSARLNGRPSGYRGRIAAGLSKRVVLEMAASDRNPSLIGESFRSATASLLLQSNHPGVLLITSLNPGDGKTTVASNLAISLTAGSRRVLLVDADRRRARLHSIFRRSNARGLSDLLEPSCKSPIEGFVVDTPVSNLFILPSGRSQHTTADLLYSQRMASIVAECRQAFDLVVIDTPPVLYLPDARILGRLSDGVILVLRAGRVRSDSIVAAERTLRRDGIPMIGTILNDWDPKTNGHGVYPEKYY